MPVQLEWHPALPVLLVTYSGIVTADEYRTMLSRRTKMLAHGEDRVIVLADLTEFEAFAGVEKVRWQTVLDNPKVVRMVVVLPPHLMTMARRNSAYEPPPTHRVELCVTKAAGLALAENLLIS